MYKAKLSSICLFFVVLLFAKCVEENGPDNPGKWPDGKNVYVLGYDGNGSQLWKNGVVQNFYSRSGITLPSSSAIISTVASSVFVSGDDVYVSGWDIIVTGNKWTNNGGVIATNGDEVVWRARLWKNGEIQNLDGGTYPDQALSVFVSGNDVYVVGREALDPVTNPNGWAFKVWKNGVAEIFAKGGSNWTPSSIFVSAGNVYVTGYNNNTSSGLGAVLWKNGVAESFAGESAKFSSVFVSGGDVYVAGCGMYSYMEPGGGTTSLTDAQLWKNGKIQKLTDKQQNAGTLSGNQKYHADALSVYVADNGDVYVAGYDGDEARLWKNGTVQNVADSKDAMKYNSVFVKGNDVYLAGCVQQTKKVSGSGLLEVYSQATVWINGKKLNLKVMEGVVSEATSVFVK